MNKEHLIPAICEALGIPAHEHHVAVGIDKTAIKAKIKALKGERDKAIEKSAYLAGFGAVYFYVIVVSFAPIAILGEDGTIPAKYMPGLLVGAALCQAYAMSIATLVKYGRGGDDGE